MFRRSSQVMTDMEKKKKKKNVKFKNSTKKPQLLADWTAALHCSTRRSVNGPLPGVPTAAGARSSIGTSSFKSKLRWLHWQWRMDLIATERLVSTLKNPQRQVLCSSHLGLPPVCCSGRNTGRIGIHCSEHTGTNTMLFLNNIECFHASWCRIRLFQTNEQTLEWPIFGNELWPFDLFELLLHYIVANYSTFLNVQPNGSVKWPFIRFKSW